METVMMLTDLNRAIRLKCALQADGLVLLRMRGHEELGRLAQWDLELLAERSDLALAPMLGSDLSVSLELPGGGEREFNGIVTAFELVRPASTNPNRPAAYRATVRPRLWLLTRASHCRFFHDMTVPAIVSQVLSGYQIDFDNRCYGELYEPRALRAVSGERLRFRQPSARARRHLLLLRASRRQAHADPHGFVAGAHGDAPLRADSVPRAACSAI